MDGWTPIFDIIVDSSLWLESDIVIKVYLTMLAKKNRNHKVYGTAFNIAQWAKKTEAETIEALKVLAAPDTRRLEPQEFEGRRIEKQEDGSWLILNGQKYRQRVEEIKNRSYKAQWQAEYRARQKSSAGVPDVPGMVVPGSDQSEQPVTKNNSRLSVAHPTVAQGDGAFDVFWSAFPKKIAKGAAEKAFKKNGCSKCIESILKALELQKGSEQWRRDGGQYIPYPATWLNRQQWNDQPVLSGPAEGNPSVNGSRPPGLVQKDIEADRKAHV